MKDYNPFNEILQRLGELEQHVIDLKNTPSPERQEPDKPLTVAEAATFLNITIPTIYSKVSRGELPYMKDTKRIYFSRAELMAYLKDKTHAVEA